MQPTKLDQVSRPLFDEVGDLPPPFGVEDCLQLFARRHEVVEPRGCNAPKADAQSRLVSETAALAVQFVVREVLRRVRPMGVATLCDDSLRALIDER